MAVSQAQANADLAVEYGSGTPANIIFALTTSAPSTTGSGSIVEPTSAQYGGYARVTVANNTTNFPAPASGQVQNGTTITFPTSTGGASSPVTVTHLVTLSDATFPAAGRIIDILPLPSNTTIANGNALSFPPNSITITES